jgi:signal transduction histidine kinase
MAARAGEWAGLPEPQYGDLDDYLRWQYYSDDGSMNDIVWRRMSFVARVIRAEGDGESSELVVAVSNVTCRVHLEGPLPDIFENAQEMRPLARITAVAEPSVSDALTDDRQPVMKSISFAAASPGDIEFIPDGEWRRRMNARVLNAAALAVGTLLAALIAIGIVRIVRDKRERGRIAAITAERKRMAADLHDTIEQNLAGAKMLMESSLSIAPDVPPAVAEAVKGAAAVLAHAKSEIRATIFNLRCDEMFDRKPEDVFREMMRHLDRGKVNARCRLRGLPDHLPGAFFSDLIGIVQEATTNALKHGRAKNIVLVSDPSTGDGKRGFVLRVLNDGEPFDAATALGPESGHFGLAGMRERAKRNGMRILWETEGRWTSVKVEVSAI